MKIVIQRVSHASVTVSDSVIGSIEKGLLLLVGFGSKDASSILPAIADKIYQMRIFENEAGRFDRSLKDINGEILLVPQFTLYADTTKGRRPEFFGAMKPNLASELFDQFLAEFKKLGIKRVESGKFQANMQVELVNDGPVTINLEA